MNLNDKQKIEYIIRIRKKIAKSLCYIILYPMLFLFEMIMFITIGILGFPFYVLINLCKNEFLKELKDDYIYLIDFCFGTLNEAMKDLMGE